MISNENKTTIYFPEREEEVSDDMVIKNIYPIPEDGTVILVLTPGKVASKSIVSAIENNDKNNLVYHLHSINRSDYLIKNKLRDNRGKKHLLVGMELKRILMKNKNLNIKIMSGFRDPIAFYLSNIFENYHNYSNIRSKKFDFQEAVKKSFEKQWLETYFEKELYNGFGIDIFKFPFNRKLGYSIIIEKNVSILLYKYEMITQIFTNAIMDFLGITNASLPQKNVRLDDKSFSELYKQVKKTLKFKKEFLEKVYTSDIVDFFYTKEEKESFLKGWASNE